MRWCWPVISALAAAAALALPAAAKPAAPAWLRAAAAGSLPANLPADAVAVVLRDEQTITVGLAGQTETQERIALKILRPEARDEWGSVVIPFDNETKITHLAAWTIAPDGSVLASGKHDIVETGLSPGALYSDDRQDLLAAPAADPGDIVGFAYTQQQRSYLHETIWDLQRDIPVAAARLTLQLPLGWKMSAAWAHYAGPASRAAGGDYEWDVADVPALPPQEPRMPAWGAQRGRLVIRYFPAAAPSDTWAALGDWYLELARGRRQPTPAIAQAVAQLTAAAATPLDKIRALASFVQRQVRYVAIEIGVGDYQPHAAGEVFNERYGDCKDKATLLSAMLRQIGVASYYVLINAERGVTLPAVPSLGFDHVILAIRLPAGARSDGFYAAVQNAKLGTLLFFDPTDPYCPLGYLPATLQDNFGLLAAPAASGLVRLPLLPPPTNRLLRVGHYTLDAAGNLSGETQEVRWGAPAENQRAQFLAAAPKDRAKIFEDFLGQRFDRVQLGSARLGNLTLYRQNFVETYGFVAAGYATASGNLVALEPCVIGRDWPLQRAGPPRRYPLAFAATALRTERFEITLPPGYTANWLPPPMHLDDAFVSYSSSTQFAAGVLIYTGSFARKRVLVPVAQLPQLRRDFAAIAADQRSLALFAPAPVAANRPR